MTQLTLLDMTQNILSALNSDQVNSISDTPESLQVAQCIRTAYLNMQGRLELPEWTQLIQLNDVSDSTKPVLMTLPSGTSRLQWLKYYDSNPDDGSSIQTDQYGAYSQHDVNTDLEPNANGWSVISSTTNTIGLGQATFTIPSGVNLISPGQSVTAQAGSTFPGINSMSGTVVGYTGATLTLNITSVTGTGTFSFWTIFQSGAPFAGPGYKHVDIMCIEDFLEMTSSFDPTEDNVQSYMFTDTNPATQQTTSFIMYYKNNIQPRHCCVIRNYWVLFDSYDNTQDSTLQPSKTQANAWIYPDFLMYDTFIPNLDDEQFPLLLNEAKSLAFLEIKRSPHPLADKEINRQLAAVQKYKSIANRPTYYGELPNFGRGGSGFQGMYLGRPGYGRYSATGSYISSGM